MNAIEALEANIGNVSDRDKAFALSLLAAARRGRLSEKQEHWIKVLADRATGVVRETAPALTPSALYAMLLKARTHLKYPKVRVKGLTIYLSGTRSNLPDTLNVKRGSEWLGRILPTGQIHGSLVRDRDALDTVTKLCENPVEYMASEGRLHGVCCYCATALKDERSTSKGYGPVCAKHYGLPWGD